MADIERWSAEAVRDVFHTATARGNATLEASRQLSTLSVFDTWKGATADARKHSNAQIRQDLDAHGQESLTVARAARKAADNIEKVQSELRTLRYDATELHMTIDPVSNTIVPAEKMPPMEAAIAEMQLQPRLDKILAEANSVDAELAAAINMADGDTPISQGPHDNRPEIQRALSQPLPKDPKQFADLWNQLTPEEKNWLYGQDHNIGNHPGMPWNPSDPNDVNNFHLGKDHYNRMHLPELEQQAQANVDRLQHTLDNLTAQQHPDGHAVSSAQSQLAAARTHLQGFKNVEATINSKDGPKRYLGQLDDAGHAAIAINNPDTAKRNAILVPGTGQDLTRMDGSDGKSLRMYRAAIEADRSLGPQDVAVTTWMGYDRPMGLGSAYFPDLAQAGGPNLDAFEAGERASHIGAPSIDTAIGHSYGSTLVGGATIGGNHLDVNNVVGVGSPGMLAGSAQDLSIAPGGHVFAIRAENDAIGAATIGTRLSLGLDPLAKEFGATVLAADPGPAGPLGLPTIGAHSSYWDTNNKALANMGSVIAGVMPPFPGVPE